MKKFVLFTTIAASIWAAPAEAKRTSVPEVQSAIMQRAAAQNNVAIALAKSACEAAGGYFDPSRIDIRVESETRSRYDRRGRGGYQRDIIGHIFGTPRPTDYRNEVQISVDVNKACLRSKPKD
jgi:hypothetical protein